MSLTVTCETCRIPDRPRQIVQWRVGPCRDCCTDFVSRHLVEHPGHKVSVTGSVSVTPFGDVRVERLFGKKKTA